MLIQNLFYMSVSIIVDNIDQYQHMQNTQDLRNKIWLQRFKINMHHKNKIHEAASLMLLETLVLYYSKQFMKLLMFSFSLSHSLLNVS